jgi:adenylate kinase family enzyme
VGVSEIGPWPSLLLVGPTGSGKTPLGRELERRGLGGRPCVHFDFGANLRRIAAASDVTAGLAAEELAAVRASLATGALFEARDTAMILKVLRAFARETRLAPDSLLVLNGLPRHAGQARALESVIAVERVVYLQAAAAVIRDRLRMDPGGDRTGRVDDSIEAVERRLADFRERTLPLVDHYRRRGVPVTPLPVTAAMTAGEMYEALAAIMMKDKQGVRP